MSSALHVYQQRWALEMLQLQRGEYRSGWADREARRTGSPELSGLQLRRLPQHRRVHARHHSPYAGAEGKAMRLFGRFSRL